MSYSPRSSVNQGSPRSFASGAPGSLPNSTSSLSSPRSSLATAAPSGAGVHPENLRETAPQNRPIAGLGGFDMPISSSKADDEGGAPTSLITIKSTNPMASGSRHPFYGRTGGIDRTRRGTDFEKLNKSHSASISDLNFSGSAASVMSALAGGFGPSPKGAANLSILGKVPQQQGVGLISNGSRESFGNVDGLRRSSSRDGRDSSSSSRSSSTPAIRGLPQFLPPSELPGDEFPLGTTGGSGGVVAENVNYVASLLENLSQILSQTEQVLQSTELLQNQKVIIHQSYLYEKEIVSSLGNELEDLKTESRKLKEEMRSSRIRLIAEANTTLEEQAKRLAELRAAHAEADESLGRLNAEIVGHQQQLKLNDAKLAEEMKKKKQEARSRERLRRSGSFSGGMSEISAEALAAESVLTNQTLVKKLTGLTEDSRANEFLSQHDDLLGAHQRDLRHLLGRYLSEQHSRESQGPLHRSSGTPPPTLPPHHLPAEKLLSKSVEPPSGALRAKATDVSQRRNVLTGSLLPVKAKS
jgi:hypothetical protein